MEGVAARQGLASDVMENLTQSGDNLGLTDDDVAKLIDASWKFNPGAFRQFLKENYFPNASDKQLDKIQGWFFSTAANPFNPNGRVLLGMRGGGADKTITDEQFKAINNILDAHKSDPDAQGAKAALADAVRRGDLKIVK